jgi:hypothetical protein
MPAAAPHNVTAINLIAGSVKGFNFNTSCPLCQVYFHPFPALHDDSLSGPVPSMGRITGSASIETLVRVGIEKENGLSPESKMVVLHDFTPCVDDELDVKRGQVR